MDAFINYGSTPTPLLCDNLVYVLDNPSHMQKIIKMPHDGKVIAVL